ncbi:glutamate racemase [Moraxella caviae]|uniref:Glutamate racemase n=1 Tax=Moraxella caviae TaxID=34060 RepID=A0A1S9ZVQ6_9GAMM|nr:glutamate racemase [Moraxella caviae]OOR87061.1 glutamate racemase [Moraxella caviae]STZ13800.1 Glutamate racemase [Moraxella caviae]VEW10184.1 Glutamate racemase [Moraxella caviae]VEW10623.1 Glutamate racemase [Moraxella caviae]
MINQHPDFVHDPDNAPIGVFDSGVGGLSVYQHLQAAMPNERFIYYADTQNVPYGNKSGDEILLLTIQAVARLCKRGCKLIVIACNSASAHSLDVLRLRCSVPIVGLVPAVKPACAITKTKKIAVLATRATLEGRLLDEVISTAAAPQGVTVYKHFEPMLVPWVESGMPIDSQVADLLVAQTKRWADECVDVVVLGCTHYPFFRKFLQRFIDDENLPVSLVDSGLAIAERVKSLLAVFRIASNNPPAKKPLTFYASRLDEQVQATVRGLIDDDVVFVGNDFMPVVAMDELM